MHHGGIAYLYRQQSWCVSFQDRQSETVSLSLSYGDGGHLRNCGKNCVIVRGTVTCSSCKDTFDFTTNNGRKYSLYGARICVVSAGACLPYQQIAVRLVDIPETDYSNSTMRTSTACIRSSCNDFQLHTGEILFIASTSAYLAGNPRMAWVNSVLALVMKNLVVL
jgi:hypothetical protein